MTDGYYVRYEFTSSEWNVISPSLTNEGKHNRTESQIRNRFIGRGFGNFEAAQETAWLMTINHGFIADRSGSIVYMDFKIMGVNHLFIFGLLEEVHRPDYGLAVTPIYHSLGLTVGGIILKVSPEGSIT